MLTLITLSIFLALCGGDAAYNPGPDSTGQSYTIPAVLVDILPMLIEVGQFATRLPQGAWPYSKVAHNVVAVDLVERLDTLTEAWTSHRHGGMVEVRIPTEGDSKHAHVEESAQQDVETFEGPQEATTPRERAQCAMPPIEGFEDLT